MPDYPKPDGYVGSANDDDFTVMNTGSGGRLSLDPPNFEDNNARRNDQKDAF